MSPDEQARIERARWEGSVERAMSDADDRLARIEATIQRIENRQNEHGEDLAAIRTRVLLYGAVVGGVGTLMMLLVLAVATKALG